MSVTAYRLPPRGRTYPPAPSRIGKGSNSGGLVGRRVSVAAQVGLPMLLNRRGPVVRDRLSVVAVFLLSVVDVRLLYYDGLRRKRLQIICGPFNLATEVLLACRDPCWQTAK